MKETHLNNRLSITGKKEAGDTIIRTHEVIYIQKKGAVITAHVRLWCSMKPRGKTQESDYNKFEVKYNKLHSVLSYFRSIQVESADPRTRYMRDGIQITFKN